MKKYRIEAKTLFLLTNMYTFDLLHNGRYAKLNILQAHKRSFPLFLRRPFDGAYDQPNGEAADKAGNRHHNAYGRAVEDIPLRAGAIKNPFP